MAITEISGFDIRIVCLPTLCYMCHMMSPRNTERGFSNTLADFAIGAISQAPAIFLIVYVIGAVVVYNGLESDFSIAVHNAKELLRRPAPKATSQFPSVWPVDEIRVEAPSQVALMQVRECLDEDDHQLFADCVDHTGAVQVKNGEYRWGLALQAIASSTGANLRCTDTDFPCMDWTQYKTGHALERKTGHALQAVVWPLSLLSGDRGVTHVLFPREQSTYSERVQTAETIARLQEKFKS